MCGRLIERRVCALVAYICVRDSSYFTLIYTSTTSVSLVVVKLDNGSRLMCYVVCDVNVSPAPIVVLP